MEKSIQRMIFHIPMRINRERASASSIRPVKMIEAFERLGYEVILIEGNASQRKKRIKEIKHNIRKGVTYDFLYSESSTMPTLLTEKHHCPTHPFLDFSFFSFCRKHGIKIGLFYRDIYWKFELYGSSIKKNIAKYFYRYDLLRYKQLVDVLYLPSRAILTRPGTNQKYVRVLDKNNQVVEKDIVIGLKADDGLVEILSGLEENETVVLKIL